MPRVILFYCYKETLSPQGVQYIRHVLTQLFQGFKIRQKISGTMDTLLACARSPCRSLLTGLAIRDMMTFENDES